MNNDPSAADFFDAKYRANPDPWDFETDPYEQRRYQSIINALGNHTYSRSFEPGCSIGVLTERLAAMSTSIEAMDASATAVVLARQRCQRLPNVRISVGVLPDDVPSGTFDLIAFSEIGYYFGRLELAQLIGSLVLRLASGGTLIAAHWLGESADHKLSGDEVHEEISLQNGLTRTHSQRYQQSSRAQYRLEKWLKL